MRSRRGLIPFAIAFTACAPRPALLDPPNLSSLEQVQADATKLRTLVHSDLAQQFLRATSSLPHRPTRTLFRDASHTHYYAEKDLALLDPAARAGLERVNADEELYYNTKYGSPLAYARALDVLSDRGFTASPGTRMLDFGYGLIGQLRLLASLGLDVTGVDVDPLLPLLYGNPDDVGTISGFGGHPSGSLRLIDGHFPADPAILDSVGDGYDLIISKNTLKKGDIHPDRLAEDRFLIHLGVDDPAFLGALHRALKPGGWMLLYNICPKPTPPDQPFIPWSDGRSPFSEVQWKEAGFEVLFFDQDDTPAIRVLGHALGWDQGDGAMDLENDLSVLYTLVRRS